MYPGGDKAACRAAIRCEDVYIACVIVARVAERGVLFLFDHAPARYEGEAEDDVVRSGHILDAGGMRVGFEARYPHLRNVHLIDQCHRVWVR